jgi:hypothetical protein
MNDSRYRALMNGFDAEVQGKQWDVFVSHNRQDKPWARAFVKQLRDAGLQVFFDEDSVSVGGEFHREVTAAISQSRTFVFIITAASILSPWVADEINTALHYRAENGHELKIIPLYLEAVRFENLGLKPIAPVYLTEKGQRNERYSQLVADLAAMADSEIEFPESSASLLPWPGSREPSDSLKINDGGKALAIGAHWDDILLGCLGTLLRLQLLHDYTVTVAVLCTAYTDRYYGSPQDSLISKANYIYRELEQRFAINFNSPGLDGSPIMDRAFRDKEDLVETRLSALAHSFSDCDLIFTPPPDDGHVDHSVTGRLVQSHFRRPEQTILDYEVKRYTDRSFVPNIFVNLDADSPDGTCIGALKVRFLSELVVAGKDLRGSATHTRIAGSEFVFGRQPLEARLLINALDYSGNKRITYGEVFRGRISL